VQFTIFEFFKSSEYNITKETASSIDCVKIGSYDPHQVTLDKLAAANVKVYRADFNGTIIFKSYTSAITVSIARLYESCN